MQIDVVTLFPELIDSYTSASILGKAQAAQIATIASHNLRDFTTDKHRVTDEPPFGGGGGMVLKPEPLFAAVESLRGADDVPVILLSPQGEPFSQSMAQALSSERRMILLCGRYEGYDERVRQQLVTREISIGDYVLTGGELAALVVVDAVVRLLPGALGAAGAAVQDSHATGLLEGPHYTKPAAFRGWTVPDVLRSGHQQRIDRWRRETALRRTWERRPEMLLAADLSPTDQQFLAQLAREEVERLQKQKGSPT